AGRPVGQNGCHAGRYFVGGEIVLHELWHNFFSGNQVDHGKAWDFCPWLSKYVRERRDAVNHHEGSVHHGSLDGSGAAGDDARARMKQCGESVRNQGDLRLSEEGAQKVSIQGGGDREQKFVVTVEQSRRFQDRGQIHPYFFDAASWHQSDPEFSWIKMELFSVFRA